MISFRQADLLDTLRQYTNIGMHIISVDGGWPMTPSDNEVRRKDDKYLFIKDRGIDLNDAEILSKTSDTIFICRKGNTEKIKSYKYEIDDTDNGYIQEELGYFKSIDGDMLHTTKTTLDLRKNMLHAVDIYKTIKVIPRS